MKIIKKTIFLGLVLIFMMSSISVFSFASEEKEHINRTLELLGEEKYNEAVIELEEALVLIKGKADLEFVKVSFTQDEAWGFGMYAPRGNSTFAQGEIFFIYGEAKNYTIKETEKELYEIYLKEDIYIIDQYNNILFGQVDFLDYHIMSHSKNFDLFINNTITQSSPSPVGNYKFRLVLKDVFSQKTTEALIKFTVIE